MRIDYSDLHEIAEFEAYVESLESDNECLTEALNAANNENARLKNEIAAINRGQVMDGETIKRIRQENCDHEYVGENWVNSCFYTSTCRKCGKVETFYQRD